jgi:hypothetical protein
MSTDERSTKILAITVSIFFFTSYLSETFLVIYFKNELGMSIPQIIVIMGFSFLVVGLLPILLLRTTIHFERIISLGIVSTLLFFVALALKVTNPVILGLVNGLSIATFWPSFNLLQFRLTETKERAFKMSMLSHAIPSMAGIIGPAIGGFVIGTYGFLILFAVSILLFFASLIVSMKIRCKPANQKISVPKNGMFKIFMIVFVLMGLAEGGWLAYPFFVLNLSSTYINMGLVVASSSLIITLANLAINKLSDTKGVRVEFTIMSVILSAIWYFAIAHATSMVQIVALSSLSGFAGAFWVSWFAYFGDSFGREHHASILVIMEVALMMGRIVNLIPTYYLITDSNPNYSGYFIMVSLLSLLLIPFLILLRKISSNKASVP